MTKKQYINGLNHDLNFFLTQLKGPFIFWYLGDRLTHTNAREEINAIEEELEKLTQDKTYKPWRELNY